MDRVSDGLLLALRRFCSSEAQSHLTSAVPSAWRSRSDDPGLPDHAARSRRVPARREVIAEHS